MSMLFIYKYDLNERYDTGFAVLNIFLKYFVFISSRRLLLIIKFDLSASDKGFKMLSLR